MEEKFEPLSKYIIPSNNGIKNDIKEETLRFMEWRNEQKRDYLGGEFLYDIKGYYKRLKESELFDYWLKTLNKNG